MVISRNFIIVYYHLISAICDACMCVRIVDSKMKIKYDVYFNDRVFRITLFDNIFYENRDV